MSLLRYFVVVLMTVVVRALVGVFVFWEVAVVVALWLF